MASGGWPTASVHGVAASKQLAAVLAQVNEGPLAPHARRIACQQCTSIMETFLKLGDIEMGHRALKAARKQQVSDATTVELLDTHAKCIEQLLNQWEAVDQYSNPETPTVLGDRDALSGAIDALKRLDGFAAKWHGLGAISCAAAACNLLTKLAQQVKDAPTKHSDGRIGLLHALGKKGIDHLTALASKEKVIVSSIDRYQGSENDVVIVSLVRSNESGDIGFLRERARRVVAQSRARLGMIFVGNRATFTKSKTWATLITKLQSRGRIGGTVPLCCAKHGDRGFKLFDVASAERSIQCGVCTERCGELMSCGVHHCKQLCHGGTEQHLICRELVLDACCSPLRHAINRQCFQSAADVACIACEKLEREREEKEKREAAERERRAQVELNEQIEKLKRQPPGLQKDELICSGASKAEYLSVVDRTEKYVQNSHSNPIAVSRIEKLYHPLLAQKYYEAKKTLCASLRDCVELTLFHGTDATNTRNITEGGFHLPGWKDTNMFGAGVYFATDSTKSAQDLYTKGSHCLILCDVLLGKSCTVEGLKSTQGSKHPLAQHVKQSSKGRLFLDVDYHKMSKAHFDSVFAPRGGSMHTGGVQFDEYIVYGGWKDAHGNWVCNQALPKYIVHFEQAAVDVGLASTIRGSSGIRWYELKPSRSHDLKDPLEAHFRFVESQVLRMMKGGVTLAKVELVQNADLMKRFDAKQAEFKRKGINSEVVFSFHGTTSRANVENIVTNNFDMARLGEHTGDKGFFGAGIYFSDFPQTSMGYGGNANMLMCKLLPGEVKDVGGCLGAKIQGNSHRTGRNAGGYGQELVIDNADQILPCYILHFSS